MNEYYYYGQKRYDIEDDIVELIDDLAGDDEIQALFDWLDENFEASTIFNWFNDYGVEEAKRRFDDLYIRDMKREIAYMVDNEQIQIISAEDLWDDE